MRIAAISVLLFCPIMATANLADHLTTSGKQMWIEEDLGPQIRISTLMSGALSRDGKLAYASIMGEPSAVAVFDTQTGALISELPVDGAGGSYGTLVTSAGRVFLSSHPDGFLYEMKDGRVHNLGKPHADVTFIWELAEGEGGKIYGACYPKSIVFEYDPDTQTSRTLGSALDGEDYARCITYSPARKKLYIGIGSHAAVIELDPATGEKRDLLPEKHRSAHFIYSIACVGDRLLCRVDPSNSGFVLNLADNSVECELPAIDSSVVSPLAPGGESCYYTGGGKLLEYDLKKRAVIDTGIAASGSARGFAWVKEATTTPLLRAVLTSNCLLEYAPQTAASRVVPLEVPKLPIHLHNIAAGPDGKIYTSGYVSGNLGIFDPVTREHSQIGGVKQAEGIAVLGDKLYFGTYPRAIISVFDTALPPGRGNPREVFRLEEQGQDRPFGMLAVPETGEVYIGTVPGYGLLGGVMAILDTKSSKTTVLEGFIPGQSVVSLIHANGMIVGGTTIYGGLGIDPTEKEAKLFLFDIRSRTKVYETAPVAGKKGVGGLQTGGDGLVYGWADDTVFAFDPEKRKVVYSDQKVYPTSIPRHFWRGTLTLPPVDDVIYGCGYGQLFSFDTKSREYRLIAKGKPSSVGSIELIAADKSGNLYFVQQDRLFRLKPRPTPEVSQ